jgi:uncharacterized protein (UPF0297 family)
VRINKEIGCEIMSKLNETQKIGNLREALKDVEIKSSSEIKKKNYINTVLGAAYDAMVEKGYNPVNQLVGYIISGDPTYITSYKDARKTISKLERDEILEEVINYYVKNNL